MDADPYAEHDDETAVDDETTMDDEAIAETPSAESPYEDDELLADEDELYGPTTDVAERLRGLVTYLATNLVDDPEAVEVEARQRGGSVFVSLRVPEEDLGKVIGRGGRIARAMRTALMITGSRDNVRASLDIED
jgi:predicted RNA-binding protein YlqC (UPF0109 family)